MRTIATCLALSLILAASAVEAQTKTDKASVSWGPELTGKTDGEFSVVAATSGGTSYLVVYLKKERYLQRMDGTRLVWQKPIDKDKEMKGAQLEKVALIGNDIVILTSLLDRKAHENQLFYSRFNQEGFEPLVPNRRIAAIPAPKASSPGSFQVGVSPDRSKLLVHLYYPKEKGIPQQSRMEMYDRDMALLWSQDLDLPYPSDEFDVESQRVDNDGSVVLLGVKYAQKSEKRELKREGKATYEYHLLTFSGSSSRPDDHPIDVPDKFLQDMTLAMGKEGDILCAGLYGNKGAFSVRGAFFLRLDRATKKIVHESYKPFSDDFITSYMTEKEEGKAKKKADKKGEELELPEFDLHEIILRDDGGAVLIAEQYYLRIVQSTYTDSQGHMSTRTTYHYFYNDVVVVNMTPDGNIDWAVKVPKRQHSANTSLYSSIATAVKGDRLYMVFNDSGKNLFLKPGDKVQQFGAPGKDALVVLVAVDRDGNVSREPLFTTDKREAFLRPKDCVQLDEGGDMFIYASWRKNYRFGLIEFQ